MIKKLLALPTQIKIIAVITAVVLVLAVVSYLIPNNRISQNPQYQAAKAECVAILKANREDFEALSEIILRAQSAIGVKRDSVKKVNFYYKEKYVEFAVNLSQDDDIYTWGLHYSSVNQPATVKDGALTLDGIHLIQSREDNGILATEPLGGGWYFYYTDEQGNKNHSFL